MVAAAREPLPRKRKIIVIDFDGTFSLRSPTGEPVYNGQILAAIEAENPDEIVIITARHGGLIIEALFPPVPLASPDLKWQETNFNRQELIDYVAKTSLTTAVNKIKTIADGKFKSKVSVVMPFDVLQAERLITSAGLGADKEDLRHATGYHFDKYVHPFEIQIIDFLEALSDAEFLAMTVNELVTRLKKKLGEDTVKEFRDCDYFNGAVIGEALALPGENRRNKNTTFELLARTVYAVHGTNVEFIFCDDLLSNVESLAQHVHFAKHPVHVIHVSYPASPDYSVQCYSRIEYSSDRKEACPVDTKPSLADILKRCPPQPHPIAYQDTARLAIGYLPWLNHVKMTECFFIAHRLTYEETKDEHYLNAGKSSAKFNLAQLTDAEKDQRIREKCALYYSYFSNIKKFLDRRLKEGSRTYNQRLLKGFQIALEWLESKKPSPLMTLAIAATATAMIDLPAARGDKRRGGDLDNTAKRARGAAPT